MSSENHGLPPRRWDTPEDLEAWLAWTVPVHPLVTEAQRREACRSLSHDLWETFPEARDDGLMTLCLAAIALLAYVSRSSGVKV